MSFDVWKSICAGGFKYGEYLYHYTSVDTAIKIICSDSLLFSPISNTNDTSESKMKIAFDQSNVKDRNEYLEMVKMISEYFKQYAHFVQILCFSVDANIHKADYEKFKSSTGDRDIYYDVSGRGFALPRMWAQYADSNEGVCFIFNKKKLIEVIERKVAFVKHGNVSYKRIFDKYFISSEKMAMLFERITKVANGSLTLLNMMQDDKDFLKYNFFEKLDDWSNEHEYRMAALIDKRDSPNYQLPIGGITSFLEGVVIGEKIDPSFEKTIKLLIKDKQARCEVKKSHSTAHSVKLKKARFKIMSKNSKNVIRPAFLKNFTRKVKQRYILLEKGNLQFRDIGNLITSANETLNSII